MEFSQLRYFVAVAETGGFAKAARRCGISQPSLSQQILKLEAELGERLFDRLGRSIAITGAGEALLPRARSILSDLESLPGDIDNELKSGLGNLTVGMIPTLAPYLLPFTLQELRSAHPDAGIDVVEDLTQVLKGRLLDASLDIAILSPPLDEPRLETVPLATETLVAVLPNGHPLAEQASITIDQLEVQPFIALHEEHCLAMQVQAACVTERLDPRIVCRSAQLHTVQACVAAGLGVSVVPQLTQRLEPHPGVQYRPIAPRPPSRTLVAAWHRSRTPSALAQAFVERTRRACARALGERCLAGQG